MGNIKLSIKEVTGKDPNKKKNFIGALKWILIKNNPFLIVRTHTHTTGSANVKAATIIWNLIWITYPIIINIIQVQTNISLVAVVYGYNSSQWTQQTEFKSGTRLFAFHIAQISLERDKTNYSSSSKGHIVVNTRFFNINMATVLGEWKPVKILLKIDLVSAYAEGLVNTLNSLVSLINSMSTYIS